MDTSRAKKFDEYRTKVIELPTTTSNLIKLEDGRDGWPLGITDWKLVIELMFR